MSARLSLDSREPYLPMGPAFSLSARALSCYEQTCCRKQPARVHPRSPLLTTRPADFKDKGGGVELISQKVLKVAKLFCQTSAWLTRDGPELWDEPCSWHLNGLAFSCNNSRASWKKRPPFAHVLSRICAPTMPR